MITRSSIAFISSLSVATPACIAYADLGHDDHADVGASSGGVGGAGSSNVSTTAGVGGAGGSGGGSGVGGGMACVPGSTIPCYGGPVGTQGVGACKAGTQTCAGDGSGYGACAGAVLPSSENCATPADDNCDGVSPQCSGTHLWSKRFGDAAGEQTGVRVATDAAGNVVLIGGFTGSLDLGGGSLKSVGGYDVFVAKFDPTGKPLWSKSFGGPGDQSEGDVAVDAAGNVFVTGNFDTSIDLGTGALASAGGTDVYLAKLDGATGATAWAKRYGDAGNASPRGLAVDASGNVLLAGYYTSSIDFGGIILSSAGGDDIFVAKISSAGVPVWSKSFGGKDYEQAYSLAVDATGNVVIVGNLGGSAMFGATTLTSAGGVDVFVAKLDAAGSPLWAKRFGDGGYQASMAVGVDAKGAILLAGTMASTIDLGAGAAAGKMFSAKLDAAGTHLWSKGYSAGLPQDVAVDGAGNVVIVGAFSGTLNPNIGAPLTSTGGGDAFTIKIDGGTGASVWAKRFGDGSDQAAFGVATDVGGSIFLTGSVEGSIDFGGNNLSSAGGRDVFLAKLAP